MAVNSETVSFDRAVTQLIHLSDRVELRKKWCSKVCNDCQQLLGPWPRSFGFAEAEKLVAEEQLKQGRDAEQESSGDCMIPEELEHLKLIEAALKKAGKTRQVFQAKCDTSGGLQKTPATETRSHSIDAEDVKSSYDSGDAPVEKLSSQRITSESHRRFSEHRSKQGRNSSLPDIGSIQSRKIQNRQLIEDGRKSSDVAVISQTDLDSLRTSPYSGSKSSKPTITTKISGSARNASLKYKPAHLTAPFLTTAQISSATKTSSGHRKSRKPCTSSVEKNVKSVQQISKSGAGHLKKSDTSTRNSSSPAHNDSSSSTVTSAWSSAVPSDNVTSWLSGNEAVCSSAEVIREVTAETVVQKSSCDHRSHSKTEKDETNAKSSGFRLLRDGTSLKVPSELGKALAANHRLCEKLKESSTAKPRKLREGESSSENFMLRLQAHMEDTNPGVFSHIQKCHRQSDCNVWLESLLSRVKALNLSEETPVDVLFQARKIVEFVLNEFYNQKDVLQSLLPCKLPPDLFAVENLREVPKLTLKIRHKKPMLLWYSCDRIDEEQLALSPRISYQTQSQLMKYLTLVHEIQLVQLRKFLLEEAGSQAVKLLDKISPNDRLFPELYRASYSLICSLGQTFPAVVRNVEDDDDAAAAAEEEEEKLDTVEDVET